MAKESRYHTTKGEKKDSFEKLTEKLSNDLLRSVEMLGTRQVLSDSW